MREIFEEIGRELTRISHRLSWPCDIPNLKAMQRKRNEEGPKPAPYAKYAKLLSDPLYPLGAPDPNDTLAGTRDANHFVICRSVPCKSPFSTVYSLDGRRPGGQNATVGWSVDEALP